jgi:hypothetical protein
MSRFAVYLVAGCAFGEMESNVRFRELVMVSDATETTYTQESVYHFQNLLVWSSAYVVLDP